MTSNPSNFNFAQSDEYKHIPALTPPPGVVPNFAAPNERAAVFSVLGSILLVIVYLFLCLRLYAKIWIKRNPGFDDGMFEILCR